MPQYRKKPVVIDAWRYNPAERVTVGADDPELAEFDTILDLIHEEFPDTSAVFVFRTNSDTDYGFFIETLEGSLHVSNGDHIIRGVKGEFYPCKPDIFAATYEEVTV